MCAVLRGCLSISSLHDVIERALELASAHVIGENMKVYPIVRVVVYWTLSTLRTGAFLSFMVVIYALVGCVLGVSYLFLAGEGWSDIPKKLPLAATVLPIFGGVLMCTALKVHELWECIHRDRYIGAIVFAILFVYTLLPVILNALSITLDVAGFERFSVALYSYRYLVLRDAGCIIVALCGVHAYRFFKQEQQTKKRVQAT